MSLASQVSTLATRIGTEFKTAYSRLGTLTSLTTVDKTSLVAALNEVNAKTASAGAQINDTGASTTTVYSSTKTDANISAALANLVASAPGTLDTLDELAAALGDDPNFAATVTAALGNRVRYDAAQTLTGPQQTQARTNIGAGTSNLVVGTTATDAKAGNYQPTAANISDSTATGQALIKATDAATARAAIGAGTGNSNLALGTTSATAKAGDWKPASTDITDSTVTGRSLITAVDAATARGAIGAGTSNLAIGTTGTTAAAGNDSRLSDARTPTAHTHTAAQISDSTTTGRALITAADAATARSAIGAGTGSSNLVIGTTAGTAADAAAVGDTATDFVTVFNTALA